MAELTSTQRQYLRRLAHNLRPLVQVGKQGVTEQLLRALDHELDAHELVKVKFLGYGDERRELAAELAASARGELVGLIGGVAIVYREQRDPERRTIVLPA